MIIPKREKCYGYLDVIWPPVNESHYKPTQENVRNKYFIYNISYNSFLSNLDSAKIKFREKFYCEIDSIKCISYFYICFVLFVGWLLNFMAIVCCDKCGLGVR